MIDFSRTFFCVGMTNLTKILYIELPQLNGTHQIALYFQRRAKVPACASLFLAVAEQAQHADWGQAVEPGEYVVCNSIWLLDDFTESNGATRVVPGSQRSGVLPRDVMADPRAAHGAEIKLLASAGTVVVFNSHTWHGGTVNSSARRRRALHSYFCRRDQPQQLDQRAYIRPETSARLDAAARYILDV